MQFLSLVIFLPIYFYLLDITRNRRKSIFATLFLLFIFSLYLIFSSRKIFPIVTLFSSLITALTIVLFLGSILYFLLFPLKIYLPFLTKRIFRKIYLTTNFIYFFITIFWVGKSPQIHRVAMSADNFPSLHLSILIKKKEGDKQLNPLTDLIQTAALYPSDLSILLIDHRIDNYLPSPDLAQQGSIYLTHAHPYHLIIAPNNQILQNTLLLAPATPSLNSAPHQQDQGKEDQNKEAKQHHFSTWTVNKYHNQQIAINLTEPNTSAELTIYYLPLNTDLPHIQGNKKSIFLTHAPFSKKYLKLWQINHQVVNKKYYLAAHHQQLHLIFPFSLLANLLNYKLPSQFLVDNQLIISLSTLHKWNFPLHFTSDDEIILIDIN